METTVLMLYTAYVEVRLPNDIADKLKSGELSYRNRWATLYYTNEKGEEIACPGVESLVDYKRADSVIFEDNSKDRELLAWKNKLEAEKK